MPSNQNIDINEVLRQLRAGGNMPEELVEIFGEEAEEHMRSIYDGLDRLRVNPNDMSALSDVRRSSHTLKGAAGAVGFEAITRLSHRMEDLLDWLGDRDKGPSETQLQLLLSTADQIHDLTTTEVDLNEAANSLVEIYSQYNGVMESLEAGAQASTESKDSNETETETETEAETVAETESAAPATESTSDSSTPSIDVEEVRKEVESTTAVDSELAEIFAEEANEHLGEIATGMSRLNEDSTDTAAMADVRRSAHTLKGAAGAVGMMAMHRLAWKVEALLDGVASQGETPTDDQSELLSEACEKLFDLHGGSFQPTAMTEELVGIYERFESELSTIAPEEDTATVAAEEATAEQATENTAEDKSATADGNATDASPKQKVGQPTQYLRVPLDRLDSLVSLVGEMIVNRSTISQRLTDFAERIEEMNSSLQRLRGIASEVENQYSVDALQKSKLRGKGIGVNRIKDNLESNEATDELDSLEFDRYTEFHLLARSLSETTSDIAVVTSELRNLYGDFDSLVNRQQRFNRDAQQNLMQVRMVPVDSISSRLERTIRTVSKKLGKKIDLVLSGENTELDKTVLEEITDPLLHLIRNGMDHGIETPEQRLAAGKPERSQIRVEALNQGTQVSIRVIDDGHGLDAAKIRAKAIERNLINADKELSTQEIHSLIFTPGFSTADSLTDVSGRGVGMDVVREAVQRLKGSIRVESVAGQGSTFTIHLPTTLAVAHALLVESGGHNFAIPMQSVQQIMRLDPSTVSKVDKSTMINIGDRMLPLKDLSNHMEIRSDEEQFDTSKPLLLVRTGDDEVAITIDSIGGGQDIVVKSMGDHLREVPGYLGATVSGDGTVIPILDPADLCGQESSAKKVNRLRRRSDNTPKVHRKTAMVIDDSLSVRRVTTNLLRAHGWEVIDAKDGVDALEKLDLADTPPDVFLCDMEMPRMDGLEFVQRIRSQEEFRTTPVAMVTSRAGEKHRKLAREAGADEHVVKPFNDDNLINLIERMVTEHRELVGV